MGTDSTPDPTPPPPEEEWYWDLARQTAVRASERGPGDQTLGPYPSEYEARRWKQRSEHRNEAWDDQDEAWDRAGDPPAD